MSPELQERHRTTAYLIRRPDGQYFGGFRDMREQPEPCKWSTGLCDAKLFGGNCLDQALKYVDRINQKNATTVGLKVVTVILKPIIQASDP